MNRSWRNSSKNSSTGFVYFNTSNSSQSPNSQNTLDTSDFLSFGSDSSPGGSPHANHFSPENYSSPMKHYVGKSPRQWGNKNQYYSPVKQMGGKYWRRNMGLGGATQGNSNNYHNVSDSQQNQNRQRPIHMNRHSKSFNHKTPNQSFDSSTFYDPSCLEDPWAELEQKVVEDRKKQEESMRQLKSSQKSSSEIEVEAEEASSDESESEDDSEEMEESFS